MESSIFDKNPHQLLLEDMFRSFYENSGDPTYDQPHPFSYFEKYILKAVNQFPDSLTLHKCASLLSEDYFFDEGTDTVVHPHVSWFPPIWHVDHFFVVQIVLKGQMTSYVSQQTIRLKEGNVCIIAPNTRHAISCFSDACVIKILIRKSTFDKAFLGLLQEKDSILARFFAHTLYSDSPHPFLYFSCGPDKELMEIIGRLLIEDSTHLAFRSHMLNSIMEQFFITLLRYHEKSIVFPEHTTMHQNENLIFILKYIQEHPSSITLPEVARLFNYSERHIQRVLRASTGMSFTEIIQTIRMKEAARMLIHSKAPVSKIASDTGYTNMGNFRKIFRRTYGMTPLEYRKQYSEQPLLEDSSSDGTFLL